MDTRVLLDYIRRRLWLWGLVIIFTIAVGFRSDSDFSIFLAMALMYLSIIPMASELQKQGPLWTQQILPIRKSVLLRTIWILQVVLPVLTIAASLLPAYGYGLVSGEGNLATTKLFQFITLGFLYTSAYFFFIALGNYWWKNKLIRTIPFVSLMVMSWYLVKMLIFGLHWDALPTRLSLVVGAAILLIVSHFCASQVLRATGQKQVAQNVEVTARKLRNNKISLREQILASPVGRSLVFGLLFLIIVMGFNLFFAMQSEKVEFLNGLINFPAMITITIMLPMFVFIVSSIHITSIRAMACLPLSSFRRSLILFSLPIFTLIPLALFMTLIVLFTTTEAVEILPMMYVAAYGLMAVHIGLACYLRFGRIAALVSVFVLMQVLMIRVSTQGKTLLPELSFVDLPIAFAVMLLTGLWIHRILGRHDNAYRQQLIFAEMMPN